MPLTIQPAVEADAGAILALLTPNVAKQSVLPRTLDDIRNAISTFLTARFDGTIAGCVALKDWGDGLYEIRSLVVNDNYAGQGIGSQLVSAILKQACDLHAREIFTLTIRPRLFSRLHFTVVNRERFNRKIWTDCQNCHKHQTGTCDETALTFLPTASV